MFNIAGTELNISMVDMLECTEQEPEIAKWTQMKWRIGETAPFVSVSAVIQSD